MLIPSLFVILADNTGPRAPCAVPPAEGLSPLPVGSGPGGSPPGGAVGAGRSAAAHAARALCPAAVPWPLPFLGPVPFLSQFLFFPCRGKSLPSSRCRAWGTGTGRSGRASAGTDRAPSPGAACAQPKAGAEPPARLFCCRPHLFDSARALISFSARCRGAGLAQRAVY